MWVFLLRHRWLGWASKVDDELGLLSFSDDPLDALMFLTEKQAQSWLCKKGLLESGPWELVYAELISLFGEGGLECLVN